MKNLIKCAILMLTFMCIKDPVQAEIMSVKTMQKVQKKVEEILKTHKAADVLVAFDIDMTLTQPDHPAIYYPAIKKYVTLYKEILGRLTPEQKDLASTLTTQIVPQKLVESGTSQIVKAMQEKGIKVIALTSSLAGKIKGFPDKMMMVRRDDLQKKGFDFRPAFKDFVGVTTFFDFKTYAGSHPMFYHGVLSTNGEGGDASKGDVLVALLRHVGPSYEKKVSKPGYYPKVVILVDDKKKHLENAQAQLKSYDPSIQFIGMEYEGAFNYAPQDISKEDFQKFWEDLAKQVKVLYPDEVG